MTDKERLENINPISFADLNGGVLLMLEDYYWLVEQAKRAEELERKTERYREALEFYANEETYETKFATDTDEIFDPFTLIELDEGKKARQALGEEE